MTQDLVEHHCQIIFFYLFKHVISVGVKHLCCGSEVTYREDTAGTNSRL